MQYCGVFQQHDLYVCSEGVPQTESFQSSQLDQFILRRSVLEYFILLEYFIKYRKYKYQFKLSRMWNVTSSSCLIRDHRLPAAGSRSSPEGETEEVEVRGGAAAGGAATGGAAGQQVPAVWHLLLRGRRRVHRGGQQLTSSRSRHRQVWRHKHRGSAPASLWLAVSCLWTDFLSEGDCNKLWLLFWRSWCFCNETFDVWCIFNEINFFTSSVCAAFFRPVKPDQWSVTLLISDSVMSAPSIRIMFSKRSVVFIKVDKWIYDDITGTFNLGEFFASQWII